MRFRVEPGKVRRSALPQHVSRLIVSRLDGGGAPELNGYAAVCYRVGDSGTEYELADFGDVRIVERIMPGAFDRALRERDDVRCLFNHDASLMLGRTKSGTLMLSVDRTGLRFACRPGDTTVARDVLAHVRRGDVSGCSFSFIPEDVSYRETDGLEIIEVRSVRLFDVGPVSFPAYTGTSVNVSGGKGDSEAPRSRPTLAWAKATLRLRELEQKG